MLLYFSQFGEMEVCIIVVKDGASLSWLNLKHAYLVAEVFE
jgi:hypothetical protein